MTALFHLAFPVTSLDATEKFYHGVLGCPLGRKSDRWVDFDFFGHQISAHLVEAGGMAEHTNTVDGKQVPVRHFGAILEWDAWHAMSDTLKKHQVTFIIEPGVRFRDKIGEQATMFFLDPSGNALEFKSFKDMSRVFAA